MCDAPQDLPPQLRMARYSGHARFVHTETRFLNGGNFQEIERSWIEEEEGEKGERIHGCMGERECLQGPELRAVVAVCDEIGDESSGGGNGGEGKQDAEESLTKVLDG